VIELQLDFEERLSKAIQEAEDHEITSIRAITERHENEMK
jgi:hypothetical protein